MPSPGEDIQSWSVTAADNGSADPLINWAEGQTRASVNNSSRSEMAAHAKDRNLRNGSIVTTGASNAQAFLSGLNYTSVPTGLVVKLKVGPGNSGSTTLNMDGTGGRLVKMHDGQNMAGGEFIPGAYVDLLFNGEYWVFLGSEAFIDNRLTGGGGVIIGQKVFTASGTYTPSVGMEACIIECVGGGGGGGSATAGLGEMMVGGGGGAGGYSRVLATAAEIGAGLPVVVGAGGIAGGGFGSSSAGGAGGNTTLYSCGAYGGSGGDPAIYGSIPAGGAGGIIGGGHVTAAGAPGMPGFYSEEIDDTQIYGRAGAGGSSYFGGGGAAVGTNTSQGNPGLNYGGGGSGNASFNGTGLVGGGTGASGVCIVTEFAGRGVPGHDGAPGAAGPIGPVGPSGPGTGDVLRSGTPSTNQIAQWIDASHIQGVAMSTLGLPVPVNVRVYTTSGGYPLVSNPNVKVLVYCKGGGGGGGGSSFSTRNGGGGGEGQEAWALTTAGALSTQNCLIGAGGASITANGNASGGDGGATTVVNVVQCAGGAGGASGNVSGQGGGGGMTGGNINGAVAVGWFMPGACGGNGGDVTSGTSGLLSAGGGKGGGPYTSAGVANSGGGGGGGSIGTASGAGGSGIAVFIEFGAI
jgi:hypothetical protein